MSNSDLISYKKISPNRTSPRNHKIDTITIHCYVGEVDVKDAASWFASEEAECSCNYFIDKDGKIALIVDEKDRSWCSSNPGNDNRAVTIECASGKNAPYKINEKVYKALIRLCADICKRNAIKELKWKADKSLIGHPEQQNMTVHRWFANKSCPGDYIYNRLGKIAEEVNASLKKEIQNGLQAKSLSGLSEKEVIEKVGLLFTEDQKQSGILACVSLAQFILESGYGHTDLAQVANNCFGMKCTLSDNTWPGSTWDGKSKFTKKTAEQDENGKEYFVTADFRKYRSVEDSISDHSAYLLGAMIDYQNRYAGLPGETDYRKAAQIIKDGGYATDVNYADKLCDIIERWELVKYNVVSGDIEPETEKPWYRVRKSWTDAASQKGAYHNLNLAKKDADENFGYSVFDENGVCIYSGKGSDRTSFKVKVDTDRLNIRTGAGVNYAPTGAFTGRGIFTITEVKEGSGAKAGWGKLKSGAGWISLDYAMRI